MSFSRDVRNQLTQLPIEKACCRQSQLLALTIVSASEAMAFDGVPHLVFKLDNAAVARHLFKLGKAIYGKAPIVDFKLDRPGTGRLEKSGTGRLEKPGTDRLDRSPKERHTVFRVAIPVGQTGMAPAMLTFQQLREAIAKKSCCRRSFLRGIFMGCGSLVSPTKAYHLEFNAPEDVCAWLMEVLAHEEIAAKCYHRVVNTDLWTVYIKDSGEIGKYLTLIGAHQALLQLEEVRIGKDLVNNVQRVVNCETANLSRTIRSAERQVQEIDWLARRGWLADLPEDWQAVAQVRLEHPYASLQELGATLEPPMSKSAVNHRLRLLHETYEARGGPRH